jgi:hypothetical protein
MTGEDMAILDVSLPSNYQLGAEVRACGVKGRVTAVTFTVLNGQGKVLYDIAWCGGALTRVLSEQVLPATPAHLHSVPAPEAHHAAS